MRLSVILLALVYAAPSSAEEAKPVSDADLTKETSAASVDDDDQSTGKTLQERIRAVSRRSFLKAGRFELAPHAGFTANDPFYRSWAFGARGAWHFNEEFALDFGGAWAPLQQPLDNFRVWNVDIEDVDLPPGSSLLAYGDIGVTYSPFYGKVALASEVVGHFDTFVSAGLGAVVDTGAAVGVHPAFEIGLGSRIYLTRWLVARVDVRDYLYPVDLGGELAVGNLLLLNFGVGFYFPFDFDYAAETLGAKG